jgi:lipid-binding SYLF domain-containing protein
MKARPFPGIHAFTTVALASVSLCLTVGVASAAEATHRLSAATTTIQQIMSDSDRTIPQELMAKAECVIVVPNLKKGAFFFGAKYGRGFVSCRKSDGVGWTSPGAIRVEGGNFGLQIGASETDIFMLVMNTRGMDRLLSSQFTLGGEASVAFGPVGRTTEAETDGRITAEILTYSRSRGLFVGLSLNGATLREDDDWNRELYGKTISNRDILTGNSVPMPEGAQPLIDELNRYSSRK